MQKPAENPEPLSVAPDRYELEKAQLAELCRHGHPWECYYELYGYPEGYVSPTEQHLARGATDEALRLWQLQGGLELGRSR
jgi:hypothetical protein